MVMEKELIDFFREELKQFQPYEKGKTIREMLHEEAKINYKRKYTNADYLTFMNAHECSFKINHPQGTNFPYYYTMFSVVSQHVQGDCIEECLDKAIEYAIAGGKKHIVWMPFEEYKTLQKLMYGK